jgi:hypothetical protein
VQIRLKTYRLVSFGVHAFFSSDLIEKMLSYKSNYFLYIYNEIEGQSIEEKCAMSTGDKKDRIGKVFTCLGLIIVSVFMGALATLGTSGSPLIYIDIAYVYVIPTILGVSGVLFGFFPEKHKTARLGLTVGLILIVAPFVLSIIVSKLNM